MRRQAEHWNFHASNDDYPKFFIPFHIHFNRDKISSEYKLDLQVWYVLGFLTYTHNFSEIK